MLVLENKHQKEQELRPKGTEYTLEEVRKGGVEDERQGQPLSWSTFSSSTLQHKSLHTTHISTTPGE